MSKQVKKDSERTSRAKTASKGEQKRRGSHSRSRSVTRKIDCRNGSECEDLRTNLGCNFRHSQEDVDKTRRYRACIHGLNCSYITENDDDCPYNHGDFQRSPALALPEPEGAKVEEVLDVVVSPAGPKKTKRKNNGVNRSALAPAPVASPVAAASSSASSSASCITEVRTEIIKLDLKLELLESHIEYLKTQVEEIRNSRNALFEKINNLVD
jgi:hypothetical protein